MYNNYYAKAVSLYRRSLQQGEMKFVLFMLPGEIQCLDEKGDLTLFNGEDAATFVDGTR